MASDEERVNIEALECLHKLINDSKSTTEDCENQLKRIKPRDVWTKGSPLVWAVKKNRTELIKKMVEEFDFNVNSKSNWLYNGFYDWCALAAALGDANEAMANLLVQLGADIFLPKFDEGSILFDLFLMGNLWAVELCYKNKWIEPNTKDNELSILHLAIWSDFKSGKSNWPMTKIALKKNASINLTSCWHALGKTLILSRQKFGFQGPPIKFANALQKMVERHGLDTADRLMSSENLKLLIEILNEEETIRKCIYNLGKGTILVESFPTSINGKKRLLRSPLVRAAIKRRFDLMEVMVKNLDYDVNLIEEDTEMNPLFAAARLGNKDTMTFLVKELAAYVDYQIPFPCDESIKGTVLTYAISLGNLEIVEHLCKQLAANVNHQIYVEEKQTTCLNFCIQNGPKLKDASIFKFLLESGADPAMKGWFKNGGKWSQMVAQDLAIVMTTTYPNNKTCLAIVSELASVHLKDQKKQLSEMSIEELTQDLNLEVNKLKWQQVFIKQKLDEAKSRIPKTFNSKETIEIYKKRPEYISEEDLTVKETVFREKVEKVQETILQLKSIQENKDYIEAKKLILMRKQLELMDNKFVCSKCCFPVMAEYYFVCHKGHFYCCDCYNFEIKCLTCNQDFMTDPATYKERPMKSIESDEIFFDQVRCRLCHNGNILEILICDEGHCYCFECFNGLYYVRQEANTCTHPLTNYSEHLRKIVTLAESLAEEEKSLKSSSHYMDSEELEMFTTKHKNQVFAAKCLNKKIETLLNELDEEEEDLKKSIEDLQLCQIMAGVKLEEKKTN